MSSPLSRYLIASCLLLCCGTASPLLSAEEARSQPNFVFIMADDLGWADVGFHDGTIPTPNLDGLAKEGLELVQHYVAPVCSPTRAGLLTGRCWSRFDVTTPQNQLALPRNTVTLPTALKSVGYDTCLVGKWHLGSIVSQGPNQFGFDHAYGSLAGGVSPWNHRYKKGPFSRTWHRNGTLLDESGHVTDLIRDESIQWLRQRQGRPFFLYVPFTAVHLPVKEPEEWLRRVPPAIVGDVPRHYAACVMHMDDAVGQIVATLDELGLRESTLLVFTSDNGGSTAENNDLKYPDDDCPNGKLPGDNRPLRGKKGTLYEGGVRVPTLVAWPGTIKARSENSSVQIIDWMPTFCALAKYQMTRDLRWDGIDLTGLLVDHKPLPTRPIYAVGPRWRARSIRIGKYKLIVRNLGADRQDRSNNVELFDIAKDPSETANLASAHPDIVRDLTLELNRMSRLDRDSVAVGGDDVAPLR